MNAKDKKSARFVLIFSVGAFLLGALSVYIWQQVLADSRVRQSIAHIETLQEQLDQAVLDKQDQAQELRSGSSTLGSDDTPASVAFEPEGLFGESLKKEIERKLVSPYSDFYTNSSAKPVSFHISESENSPGWSVTVIYNNDSYENIEYGNRGKDEQIWWTPICIEPCSFNNEFKAKYPEVVSQYQ